MHMEQRAVQSRQPGEAYQALRVLLAAAVALQGRNAHRLGVTRMEIDALLVLGVAPMGPADLARRLGITQPAASDVMRRLDQRGYLDRIVDPRDARRRPARPSAAAYAAVFGEIVPLMTAIEELADALPDQEAAAVLRFLGDASGAIRDVIERDGDREAPVASPDSAAATPRREC